MDIEIKAEYGYYKVYVNGIFYCTCDNMKEVKEEVANIEK